MRWIALIAMLLWFAGCATTKRVEVHVHVYTPVKVGGGMDVVVENE